jgi:hypothetical protein
MKTMISTFFILLLSLTNLFAQNNIVLDDFESGLVGFTTEVHYNPDANFNVAIVDNPVKAGINLSNKVWEWKRIAGTNNQPWAGFWAALKTAVPAGYTSIEVKYLRKNATSQLRMKVEGTVTKEFNPVTPASKTNVWETMVFDLTANGIKNINVLSLFPDNYEPIDVNAIVYIDDIKVIYEAIVLPTVSSLTLFDNSTDNRFHDQSWVNQTAPSTVKTENPAAPGMTDGDKLPCVTTPVKSGANALKLQWKSATGGSWMAMAAAVGWTSLDLTKMKYLKFWVNSPIALAKTDLPKIYLEAFSGNPNVTGKLLLGNYLPTGLVANTWTQVTVPLADLWAADATFASKGVIKDVFFSQNATDNVEHTLYLDEIKFTNDNIVLDDFESGTVSFTDQVNGNPPAHFDYAVVDNPFKTGINTSNKVWEWKRYDAGTDNKVWAGFYATLKNEIPTGYNRIEVKFLRKNATSQLRIKCEGAVSKEFNAVTPASKTNVWETMVFDLTANGIKNIKVLSMFPDYYEPINPAAISYIDDITVVKDETVVVPPPPSTLTLFDNSADNRFYDQSWVNQTAPSTVVTESYVGPGLTDGDKLPVVTTPVKAGANALKLQWKSVANGDWKAMTASIGWKVFDLTTMKYLKFWVNSPVALDKTALPKIYLEAASAATGTPTITGKVLLSAYLPNGLTANTWTEVTVPLADLWAADATYTAKDLVKDVFFTQNTADNVGHTLYLDEFTFASFATGINPTVADKVFKPYYTNGEIIMSNYTGYVRVYDLIGRNVAEGITTNGILRVNLKKGIYIVNTTEGNAKIVLQ